MTEAPPATPRAWYAALVFGVVALVTCVHIVDYLPTNDGPQHIMLSTLENSMDGISPALQSQLEHHPPLTANGFRTVYRPLERLMGWAAATRWTESLWLVTWALGFVAMVTALRPERRWWALVGFGLAFNWTFYMGFFSFHAATALGMLAIALELRMGGRGPVPRVALAALLFVQATTHVFAAVVTGPILVAVAASRAPAGERVRRTLAVIACGVPAAAIALLTVLHRDSQAHASMTDLVYYHPPLERLALAAYGSVSGPLWRAALPVAGSVIAAFAALAGLRRREPTDVALAVCALVCFGLFWATPYSFPGWQGLSPRFLPFALVCGLAVVPIERMTDRAIARTIGAVGGLFALGSLMWSAAFHLRLQDACAPALAALDAPIERSGYRLFVPFHSCLGDDPLEDTPQIPYASFLLHVGGIYATEQGGMIVPFHGSPEIHAFTLHNTEFARTPTTLDGEWMYALAMLRVPTSTADEAARRDELARGLHAYLAEKSAAYEDVMVYAPRDERQFLVDRGFVADWESDELGVYTFAGCPVSLALPPAWSGQAVRVQFGWFPSQDNAFDGVLRRDIVQGEPIALPRTPCGPMWLRLWLDTDGSDTVSPGDQVCQGPPPGQPVVLDVGADGVVFPCAPVPVSDVPAP